jgi:hypothetical protein
MKIMFKNQKIGVTKNRDLIIIHDFIFGVHITVPFSWRFTVFVTLEYLALHRRDRDFVFQCLNKS